jgi:hypothetical protein
MILRRSLSRYLILFLRVRGRREEGDAAEDCPTENATVLLQNGCSSPSWSRAGKEADGRVGIGLVRSRLTVLLRPNAIGCRGDEGDKMVLRANLIKCLWGVSLGIKRYVVVADVGVTKESLTAGIALAQVAASPPKCSRPFNQDYCDIGFSSLNIELGIG